MTNRSHGSSTGIKPAQLSIEQLRADFQGRVIGPDDAGYDQARTVFYGGFDRRPAVIIRAKDAMEVATRDFFGPRDRVGAGRPQRRAQQRRLQRNRRGHRP